MFHCTVDFPDAAIRAWCVCGRVRLFFSIRVGQALAARRGSDRCGLLPSVATHCASQWWHLKFSVKMLGTPTPRAASLQCRRERAREQKQIEGDTCIIRWLVAVSVACTAIRQIWVICDKSSALGCHLRVRTHGNQGARSSTHSLIVINSHPDMLVLPTALAQPRNQRMQVRASRNADRKSNP